jgi:carbonic anhydrase
MMSTWLDEIREANRAFRERVEPDRLPTERPPGQLAVITCMDPRVNLEAIGMPPFGRQGELGAPTRIIRTLGGIGDARSLVVGIHLAGIQEIAVLTHTDCGAIAAWNRADVLLDKMEGTLGDKFGEFTSSAGVSDVDSLRTWLRAFEDPKAAAAREVERLRGEPFIPHGVVIHGLTLDLTTGEVTVVEDGYASSR